MGEELVEIGPHVIVMLAPEPDEGALVDLAVASGAGDPELVVGAILDKRRRNIESFGWISPVPCVYNVDDDARVWAWESDYAFSSAIRAVMPEGAGFPLFGGPLGMGVALVCNDGVVMTRRAQNLAWAAGRLRLASEGVTMGDLVGTGPARDLSVEMVARRLCAEELGLAAREAVISPIGLSDRPGQVTVLVKAALEVGFSDLEVSVKEAPDGYEGVLVCFPGAREALAAMGSDVDNASARTLASLARLIA